MYLYEHHSDPLLPRKQFVRRIFVHFLAATLLVVVALGIGIIGYHETENLSWLDSLLNASMILGGMGPVNTVVTTAGKLFASFYALFSGLVFIAVAGIVIAPAAHRLLHRLHLPTEAGK